MDMSQYMGIFIDESQEHLQALNTFLLELENNPSKETLDEIFRAAHTLKGMAATMGFENIAKLTHQMENVLHKLRNQEILLNSNIVDVLFHCLDTLENMVNGIINQEDSDIDIGLVMEMLKKIEKGETLTLQTSLRKNVDDISLADSAPSNTFGVPDNNYEPSDEISANILALEDYEKKIIQEARRRGYEAYNIIIKLQEGCLMKGARAFMVFRNLEDLGEIIKSVPEVQDLEEEKFDLEISLVFLTTSPTEKIEKTILSIAEIERVFVIPVAMQETDKLEAPPVQYNQVTGEHKNQKRQEQNSNTSKANQTVRVDIEKLDKLMNLVGELVISKTRLDQIGQIHGLRDLNETTEHIDRISSELQNLVMKVRMVPVEHVFNRFPRMVRDLSKELGKEIDFQVVGKETELDRTVIDEIGEPIVHLLRNSLDHGIESPEEREKAGKPKVGTIYLRARHEGNNVVIEVEDDGRGINPQIIRKKAVEKGVLSLQEAEKLSDEEAINLIFAPGFSTADEITGVSGRGVGMDAVQSKIESLSGSLKVETEAGKGTRISIWLPLTLAIIQALLVKLGEEIYAIPLGNIEETIALSQNAIKYVQNREVTLLRGDTLPLLRLHKILEVPQSGENDEKLYNVVVVRKGDKRAGLIVDLLIGQQDIVIKGLGKLLTGVPGIAGATILGSGEVALILDVGAMI